MPSISFVCKRCKLEQTSRNGSIRTAIHGGRICAACARVYRGQKESTAANWAYAIAAWIRRLQAKAEKRQQEALARTASKLGGAP